MNAQEFAFPEVLEVVPFGGPVNATVLPPGSKSLTNRALIVASLASGRSVLSGALQANDTLAMLSCLRVLGVQIVESDGGRTLAVDGVDGRPPAEGAVLDAQLSGTTARFIAPLACLGTTTAVLDGEEPLRRRPMLDFLNAREQLGASVEPFGEPGHLPVQLEGPGLAGGVVQLAGDVSSQFLSGLMLSGPCMRRGLEVVLTTSLVSRPYVEMTAAVMRSFGADVTVEDARVTVSAGGYNAVEDYRIEPDASAASYFFALAALTEGRIRIEGLGGNSTQGDVRFAEILGEMGAEVVITDEFVEVAGTGELNGITVDMSDCSDTAQTLAAVAACASGPTVVTGIGFIRGKETDRIAAVVTELERLGLHATNDVDGFTVHPGRVTPAVVQTYDDHRMAMSFAVLGSVQPGVQISDPGCVAKTYPGFWDDLASLHRQ